MRGTKAVIVTSVTVLLAVIGAQRASAQAVSICKDGTKSSVAGKGACSSHGGVNARATDSAQKAARSAKKEAKPAEHAAAKDTKPATKTATKAGTKETKGTKAADATVADAKDATGKCKDGTYTKAKTRQGACSRHGGVADWLKK